MNRTAFVIAGVTLALGCRAAGEAPSPQSAASQNQAPAQKAFGSPKEAANALVNAAATNNVPAMLDILGRDGEDLVASEDKVGDRHRAAEFAARAREKMSIQTDSNDPNRATLLVGYQSWPLPIPIVRTHGKWYFDTDEGRDEVLLRRIGANELDAISVARGYDDAQKEYAATVHDDSGIHQFAQRIISTPGKHDGLAWQNPDGTWGGPVGEEVAKSLQEGTLAKGEPFHGYRFKILTGQGPAAPLGKLDYVINGAMIGGFGLIAWPAEYKVTGVKTFIVGNDGIVYQKDLGPDTATLAAAIDRYNPDPTWKRTDDDWEKR